MFESIIMYLCDIVQTSDGDVDAVLDRAAPERAAAVAGPRAHADGQPAPALLLHVIGQ